MSGKARKRTRGVGRIFRQRYRDRKNGGWKFTETFYIEYWLAGKMYREATHSTRQSDALDLLNQRRGEHALGQFVEPRAQRTTLDDLLQVVDTDYTVNGKRSLRRMREHAKHLTRFFGTTCRAADLIEPRIDGYAQHRLGEGAA